jgi:hypothetical protein
MGAVEVALERPGTGALPGGRSRAQPFERIVALKRLLPQTQRDPRHTE